MFRIFIFLNCTKKVYFLPPFYLGNLVSISFNFRCRVSFFNWWFGREWRRWRRKWWDRWRRWWWRWRRNWRIQRNRRRRCKMSNFIETFQKGRKNGSKNIISCNMCPDLKFSITIHFRLLVLCVSALEVSAILRKFQDWLIF